MMKSQNINEAICRFSPCKSSEILGAFVGIVSYSKILNENEIQSFVNQFIEIVYKKVFEITDDHFLKFAIKVYGMLVSLGGIKIAQFIEKNVASQMKSIQNTNNRQVSAALLVELFK
jgi:hypothetical protein